MDQKQDEEQASDASVAVNEWVDCFELIVNERKSHQGRVFVFAVQVLFEGIQGGVHFIHGRRDERCIIECAAGCANPVLRAPKFTRSRVLPADSLHQARVHLADQSETDGQCVHAFQPMFERANVVEDFTHVGLFLGGLETKQRQLPRFEGV